MGVARTAVVKAAAGIDSLASGASKAADGILQFAKTAEGGSASLTAMVGALPQFSGALGIFSSALNAAASITETNLKTQQQLSDSGATFNGSLTDMRTAAADSYLALDAFANVVKTNSDVFASMGGNVQDGISQFKNIQKALLAPGTETASMLATMGVSADEAASLTASFMRSQGSMNKQGLQDQKAVAASVAQYAGELTLLSEITGKSRQAIQEKMDKENQEAQWSALLATMTPEKAEKMRQGMQMAMLQGGDAAKDAFKSMAMGLPPMTEAGKLYTATQQAGVAALKTYHDRAENDGLKSSEASKLNRATLAKQIAAGKGDQEKLSLVLRADAMQGGKLAESFADATKLQNHFMKDGKMMSEQEIAQQLEEMDAKNKTSETEAATAQAQQRVMQDLTNTILAKLMPALTFLLGAVVKGAEYLGKLLIPAFDKIDFKPLMEFFNGIFEKFDWKTLTGTFSGILTTTWNVVNSVAKSMEPIFKQIIDVVNGLMPKLLPIFQDIGSIVTTFAKIVGPLLAPLVDAIGIVMGGIIDRFGGLIKVLKGIMTGSFKDIGSGLGMVFGGLVDIVSGIIKWWAGIRMGLLNFVASLGTGLLGSPDKSAEEIPKRALGGPVQKNVPTIVGEKGIELFLPSQSGNIIPNNQLTASQSTASNGNSPLADGSMIQDVMDSARSSVNQAASSNGKDSVSGQLDILNKQTSEMLRYLRETAEYSKRNYTATKDLGGNLFASV
jgi:hypothetical protein